ncbi:MAG: hypothetical protein V4773_25220 [Verrucomicrobiota bacterium]
MLRLRRFAAVFVAACVSHPLLAATARMEATAAWAENINRASSPIDWRDSMRYEARASLGLLREFRTGLTGAGEIGAGLEHIARFDNLDAATAGFAGTVRQKFGLGALAPSLALDLGLRARESKLDFEDGWTATAGLRFAKRFTPTIRGALNGDWQQHYARSDIFDTKHHRFFVTLAWDITEWLQVSHGNGRLWGSFTAHASPTIWPRAIGGLLGTHISNYYNSIPWGVTDSYGPGWVTYIVDGRVSFYWIELSPALGANTSLPLRFENRVSVNQVGVKYRQDIWTLSLLHRF